MTGEEFRVARDLTKLSQRQVARIMGRTIKTISHWERGAIKVDPLAEVLMRSIATSPQALSLVLKSACDRDGIELSELLDRPAMGRPKKETKK